MWREGHAPFYFILFSSMQQEMRRSMRVSRSIKACCCWVIARRQDWQKKMMTAGDTREAFSC
jgi:hypothetical protein